MPAAAKRTFLRPCDVREKEWSEAVRRDEQVRILASQNPISRDGTEAARQRFAPVRRGLRSRLPLAVVQIDHTKVDIQLVDDLTRTVLGRPWLTVMLDVFSRSVVGFHLSFDAPSAGGIALAIAQGVLPKRD